MKDFFVFVTTFIIVDTIIEKIQDFFNFNINFVENGFNLQLFILDAGLFFIIAIPIYFIIESVITKISSVLSRKKEM